MEFLGEVLPLILYFLGAVLIFVIIMLVIKLMDTVDKVNVLLDDVEKKSQSLNGLFNAIDSVGDTISSVNMKMLGLVTNIVEKVFRNRKNKKKKKEEEIDEYE